MKPLRIVMRAFGPYAGEQALDFGALGDRSFFLITGPTGAGKTTVLDAICYALYGTTSGSEREGRQMRSDHADAELLTDVIFDFTLGGDVYRVERSPEQERPKRRGSGTTTEPPRATLWRRTGLAADDTCEGTVVADKPSDVDAAVERLMGFHADQFRQVIMLPQGDFRRLLMADSKEREAILQTLFRTEWYAEIQEALRQARLDVERERSALITQRDLELAQANAERAAELLARLETKRADLGTADETVARLRGEADAARNALDEAKAVDALLGEAAGARRAREELESGAAAVDEKRSACARARKAAALATLLGHRDERAGEASDDAERCSKAAEALRNAIEAVESARAEHTREQGRESERKALGDHLTHLAGLVEKAGELATAERELIDARGAVDRDEAAVRAAAASIAALEAAVARLGVELESARRLAAHLPVRETAVGEARRRQLDHEQLELARKAVEQAATEYEARERHASELAARIDAQQTELLTVEGAWSRGHAALLASELHSGEPCPVCGSTDHPRPAVATGDLPSRSDLERLRQQQQQLGREVEAARQAQSEQSEKLASTRGELASVEKSLGAWSERGRADLEQSLAEAETALAEAQRAASQSEEIATTLRDRTRDLANARRAKDEADARLRDGSARVLAGADARAEQARRLLPADLRPPGAVEAAHETTSARLDELKRSLDQATTRLAECEKRHASSVSTAEGAGAAARASAARAAEAEDQLRSAIVTAGFRDEADLRGARLADVEIDGLEEQIERFDHALVAARDRERRALAAAEGKTAPDLTAITKAAADAGEAWEAAKKRRHDLGRDITDLEQRLSRLDELQKKLDALDTRYAVVGRIADVAAGKEPNRAGVPFQRFVLAALLDVVLDSASERLRIMSNNRYTLERSRERGSRRTTTGLELEVWDAYTGNARPVATLSGGESFLASLSLALGLADVVQAYAGGIHLDTIFVDEGFGTLDPEALDLALRALEDLQRGGRLVGIISHVPELRERVPARLEVTADRRGSSARFVVG